MAGGIYFILNKITGKRYIGSTNNFDKRKHNHFRALEKGIHRNYKLQCSANKYGINNFEFGVFKTLHILTSDNLTHQEQKYLDKYKTYERYMGYNICREANNLTSKPRRQATIEKQRKTFLAKNFHHSQYTKDLLSNIFKGRKPTKKALINIRKANAITTANLDYVSIGKKCSKTKLANRKKYSKTIIKVLTPNMKVITIRHLTLFCEKHGLMVHCFSRIINGKRLQYKGYYFIQKIK